ncbi:MAG: exonuclease SbcCD subunit D [Coprococcus sp.]
MKIFHLSDLHIGLKLNNRDLREDQEYIFRQIAEYAEKEHPDAILIAGDIYDKAVPAAESVEVFDSFITNLTKKLPEVVVMMISGNHDSAQRVNCFRNILCRQNIYMVGVPPKSDDEYIEKVTLNDCYGKVNFYLLPFVKPSMVKDIVGEAENGRNFSYNETIHKLIEREQLDYQDRNVMVSHQFYLPKGSKADEVERMDSEIKTVGNIDEVCADILERFDYAALGHIHKPMKVGSEKIRYCGTPVACSVSEAGQQKGIIMVELDEKDTEPKILVLPLKPLHEVRVIKDNFENVVKQSCDDYVTIILTDKEDLDMIDVRDRLRMEFANLLEIRRENQKKADYGQKLNSGKIREPFELCCDFLGGFENLDEEDRNIIMDVINFVREDV